MDCETWRERLTEDPAAVQAAFAAHAESCVSCLAYGRRLLKTEALIERALRIDFARLAPPARAQPITAFSRWVNLGAGLAAALVAGLTFWSFAGAGWQRTPEQLAEAVVEHWAHEPDSLLAAAPQVSERELLEVLFGTAAMQASTARRVSYARICRVAGQFMPHLVVQGELDPFMVLLVPGEALDNALPLASSDGALAGRIVPSGRGNIAVLGAESAELDSMTALLASTIDWNDGL